jgi:hypothetical protein
MNMVLLAGTNVSCYSGYSRTFHVPPAWKDKRIILHIGAVEDEAWVYVNGKLAGDHLEKDHPRVCWETPFEFDLSDVLKSEGENTLVIRVNDTHGGGGIWKSVYLRTDVPRRPKEGPGLTEVKANPR